MFGFTDKRIWTPVSDLSGGERRRLQMLRLLAAEPNVLLLDEPTNDLDTDTLASLEDLLDSWPGTMVVASHDRYLVERVTDTAYGMFGDGRLVHLPGGIDEYLARAAVRPRRRSPVPARRPGAPRPGARHVRGRAARRPARTWPGWSGSSPSSTTGSQDQREPGRRTAATTTRSSSWTPSSRPCRQERAQVEEAWLELAEQVPGDA